MVTRILERARHLLFPLGIVLTLTAPLTYLLVEGGAALLGTKLTLGAVLIAAHFWSNRRRDRPKRLGPWLPTLLSSVTIVSVIIVLAVVNIWLASLKIEWDFTDEGIHSLSSETISVLNGIQEPTTIYSFFTETDGAAFRANERLARYGRQSSFVTFKPVNPDLRPDLLKRFELKRYGGRVVIEAGERRIIVEEVSEQAVTAALLRATRRQRAKIWLVSGHDELRRTQDAGGLDQALVLAEQSGFEVVDLELTGALSADGLNISPADGVLLLAAPLGEFRPAELKGLANFIHRQGRVMLLTGDSVDASLTGWLEGYKIRLNQDRVFDGLGTMLGLGPEAILAQPAAPETQVTRGLTQPPVWKGARSMTILQAGPPRISTAAVMQSAPSGWGDLDPLPPKGTPRQDPTDIPGPVVLATSVIYDAGQGGHGHNPGEASHEGRMLVFGDADWLTNRLAAQPGNLNLWVGALSWLNPTPEAPVIRPATRVRSQLALSELGFSKLKLWLLDLFPMLVVAAGAMVIAARRTRR